MREFSATTRALKCTFCWRASCQTPASQAGKLDPRFQGYILTPSTLDPNP